MANKRSLNISETGAEQEMDGGEQCEQESRTLGHTGVTPHPRSCTASCLQAFV